MNTKPIEGLGIGSGLLEGTRDPETGAARKDLRQNRVRLVDLQHFGSKLFEGTFLVINQNHFMKSFG